MPDGKVPFPNSAAGKEVARCWAACGAQHDACSAQAQHERSSCVRDVSQPCQQACSAQGGTPEQRSTCAQQCNAKARACAEDKQRAEASARGVTSADPSSCPPGWAFVATPSARHPDYFKCTAAPGTEMPRDFRCPVGTTLHQFANRGEIICGSRL